MVEHTTIFYYATCRLGVEHIFICNSSCMPFKSACLSYFIRFSSVCFGYVSH